MDNLVTDEDCDKRHENCVDKVQDTLAELKTDMKNERKEWNEYREKTAGSLGRIEGTLAILVNRMESK